MMPQTARRAFLAALPVLLLAGGWRLAILLRTDFAIDGDESTVGLMALLVARLREFPVFFYGQPYMGALEAYAAALPMQVFGPVAAVLKLTALSFALATVWFGWRLARRVLGEAGGLAAGLYLALPPLVGSVWSLKLRGGYTSLLALGCAILLLAHDIGTRGATVRRCALLGLLVGLAVWLNLLCFPFVGAAGLYLLARRQLVRRSQIVALPCALLGAAPLVVANLASGGETFRFLLERAPGGPDFDLAHSFLRHPVQLLGLQAPWADTLEAPAAAAPVVLLLLCGLFRLLQRERRGPAAPLLLTLPIYYAGVLCMQRFGSDPEPRFAIVLYPVIALACGAAFAWGWERRGPGARVAAGLVLAGLLAFNLHSVTRHLGQGDGDYSGETYDAYEHGGSPARCLALLEQLGIEGLAGPHWMSYPICFLSGDRIVPSPSRYAPHAQRFRDARVIAWAVFREGPDAHWIQPAFDQLAGAHVVADEHRVDGQRLLVLRDTGHPLGAASSNSSGYKALRAIDRDPRTGWNAFERPTDALDPPALTIDLGSLRRIGCVGFLFFPRLGPPRQLGLSTSEDGQHFGALTRLEPDADGWNTPVPPRDARYVRLVAMSADDLRWQLLELFVFEP